MPEADDNLPGLASALGETIHPHVYGNADREVGGLLIGTAGSEAGPYRIVDALLAVEADEQRASLTFSQSTWEHAFAVLDRDFPDDHRIVGWYHSHPGFGIFLSSRDLFIHRSFFSDPRQVALVVDPLQHLEGLFVWAGGEIVRSFERSVERRDVPGGVPPQPRCSTGPTIS